VWRFFKKLKRELVYDPAIPFLGIYPKECKVTIKTLAHACLLQHYSQLPSYGNSPDAPQLMNGLVKCDIYTYT
jgi:hypothetical protein